MENLNSHAGGSSKSIPKTANSSKAEIQTQDERLVNPDHRYVGSYLRWLGDQLDTQRTETWHSLNYPPPQHPQTLAHEQVARDLAWIGDQLEKRQDNSLKALNDFAGDFSPCCVVLFGLFCYVIVSGIRRGR